MDPLSAGLALGMEVAKLIIIDQNVRRMAAAAGITPEQLDAALAKVRAEIAPLDANRLPAM